jgi:hypothetical protein
MSEDKITSPVDMLQPFACDLEPKPHSTMSNPSTLQLRKDHALLLAALATGKAKYRPWDDKRGEVCINGLAYAVHIDRFGCPELHDNLRERLAP